MVLRYPWNKDHSRVFHTLRKLRQVDVVLNRNQLGSDNGEETFIYGEAVYSGVFHPLSKCNSQYCVVIKTF